MSIDERKLAILVCSAGLGNKIVSFSSSIFDKLNLVLPCASLTTRVLNILLLNKYLANSGFSLFNEVGL